MNIKEEFALKETNCNVLTELDPLAMKRQIVKFKSWA
jgi:hypothetical protein